MVICVIDKRTRNNCKHCRFTKCEKSAGLVRKYVLQQYIPKVTNQRKDIDKEPASTKSNIKSCNETTLNIGIFQGNKVRVKTF